MQLSYTDHAVILAIDYQFVSHSESMGRAVIISHLIHVSLQSFFKAYKIQLHELTTHDKNYCYFCPVFFVLYIDWFTATHRLQMGIMHITCALYSYIYVLQHFPLGTC